MKTFVLIALTVLSTNIFCKAQTIPGYVSTVGLQGWYPFNNNAIDESINNNDGTVNGAAIDTDRFGNANSAYRFNGTTDFINLNNKFDYAQRTINIWVNPETIDAIQRHIYVSDDPSLSHGFTQMRAELSSGSKKLVTNACNGSFLGNQVVTENSWYMLTIVVASDSVRHYFNGGLFLTSPLGNAVSVAGYASALLGTSRFFDRFFKGKLDDLGIWNRALTQNEITNLYLASNVGLTTLQKENNLVVYPNPSAEELNLKVENNLIGNNYSIIDASGQVVLEEKIIKTNTQVDVNRLSPGLYFLKVASGNGKLFNIVR